MAKFTKISVLCLSCSPPIHAFDWTSSNIQLLHGSGYLLGSKDKDIITLEHSNGWKYGQNFLFVDTIYHESNQDPINWEAYGEAYSFFSANKITGRSFAYGPIKDIGLSIGVNAGTQPAVAPFQAYLAGGSLQFNIPGFQFLKIDVMAYKNVRLATTAFQVTPAWELPFEIAGIPLRFRGFLDYISAGGLGAAATVLFQPQLLLDLGGLLGYNNHLLIGTEYQFWHNKFGKPGVEESLPQALVMLRI